MRKTMVDYELINQNFNNIEPSINIVAYKTKLKINTNLNEEGKILSFELLNKLINELQMPIKFKFIGVKFGIVKRIIDYSKQNNNEIRTFVEYNKLEKNYEVLFIKEKDILKEDFVIEESKVKRKSL